MKNKVRTILDIAMAVLMLMQMAYSMIGETVHEVMGISLFILFLLHHALNLHWWKNLRKGRYNRTRVMMTMVDLLLVLVMCLQPISGITMSKHLFPWISVHVSSQTVRLVHLCLSNWGFALISLHIGFHVNGIKRRMGWTKTPKALTWIIDILFVIWGIRAFVIRGLWGYMTLRTQFVFFDFSESVLWFLLDYLCIMGMFAVLGQVLLALISGSDRTHHKERKTP